MNLSSVKSVADPSFLLQPLAATTAPSAFTPNMWMSCPVTGLTPAVDSWSRQIMSFREKRGSFWSLDVASAKKQLKIEPLLKTFINPMITMPF
jgi:hypothetical protein